MLKPRILIVDDEREIREAIRIYLRGEDIETVMASNGQEAIDLVKQEEIHLVLMDVMMPGIDGIVATSLIREFSNVPIIMLTAKSEDTDKIMGLSIGADDYITKPFNPMELVARVKSQLRRYLQFNSPQSTPNKDLLEVGGLSMNIVTKQVNVDGKEVRLTPTEFKILALLLKNKGRVFSINDIYENVWDEPGYNAENTVAVHIRKIREKIEINPRDPRYLKVVWGVGYKIEA
ncbi:MAG: response regulator transcription factor [Turicibacter sp.]|jgi:DNA-binding response OmpR family regulator|uniref:DNA-binding response regulator n=1 Tax=Turicibacter faecis TaxID=2963365 RepID=A0ABM8IQ21_9FIRM|nr:MULTISPECIES: response regulator transcription factor [unclassified Turicibacter]MCI8702538.1 response regulator transcription factor [Turicibacter sp.]BEH91922.1 DNA-binding response regulator [Turicibacter sp. TC023]MCU7205478.1 response regulator transcription factor [Turicibacter sp. TA25]MCU7208444.1 response regulator transcription factor [Turicibacter sp. 1E2]NCE78745.1 DNA-binding response regulator [Turicibacter sp. TS3]